MIILRYVYTLRLIGPISYLGACYIRTTVTKCIHEKMTLYFRTLTIKSHSPGFEIRSILLWLNRMRQNEKNRHKNRLCKQAFTILIYVNGEFAPFWNNGPPLYLQAPQFQNLRPCESPRAGILTVTRILTIYNFWYRDVNKRTDFKMVLPCQYVVFLMFYSLLSAFEMICGKVLSSK